MYAKTSSYAKAQALPVLSTSRSNLFKTAITLQLKADPSERVFELADTQTAGENFNIEKDGKGVPFLRFCKRKLLQSFLRMPHKCTVNLIDRGRE